MKILVLHNHYQHAGGEDSVVTSECELLKANGHEVHLFTVNNDSILGLGQKLRTALRLSYSGEARTKVAKTISLFKPDLVHAHNLFPLLSPAVYDACRDFKTPVIQTLHNFRNICPGAMLLRNEEPCERCIVGSTYNAVIGRCYRGSLLGTLAVSRMVNYHRQRDTWINKVDRFIALSQFSKERFVQAGWPHERIVVKPNFASSSCCDTDKFVRAGALFVGRLSGEKGIRTLLEAWQGLSVPLTIIGDGPLMESVHRTRLVNVSIMGRRPQSEVRTEMDIASFLVMPSICYEGFPMVLVEAFSHGLPVIVSRLGSMAEIVADGITGLHFTPDDANDLRAKVAWATEHPKEMRIMGRNARKVYEQRYSAVENYKQLVDIYLGVIA